MKSYNADIRCTICGAEPWPSNPVIRETFALLRLGPNGVPAASPAIGEWRCELHLIAKSDLPARRAPRAAPIEALTDFENIVAAESARLGEEVGHGDDAMDALATFQEEIERGLASLRKAVRPSGASARNRSRFMAAGP